MRTLLLLMILMSLAGCGVSPDEELQRIRALLGPQAVSSVADIGAGEGDQLQSRSALAGPAGKVFVTEIDPNLVAQLQARIRSDELTNVSVYQATTTSTGLPDACCDLIILRHVYHHLSDPSATLQDIGRALMPGGRLLLIDFRPAWALAPWTPDDQPEGHSGHGVTPEIIRHEAGNAGFRVLMVDEDWPGWHLVLDRFAVLLERES